MKKRKQKKHKGRELAGYRSIYKRYVIDDGWQEVPEEVIEVIDLKVERAWEEAYIQVCRERSKHKGKWLTKKVCLKYEAISWIYRVWNDNQYVGKVREGCVIRKYRETLRLERKEFAQLISVNSGVLRNWENERNRINKESWEKCFKNRSD